MTDNVRERDLVPRKMKQSMVLTDALPTPFWIAEPKPTSHYQRALVGVTERDLGGNGYAVAAFSGQSFETLQASDLGPSDFVPKLTLFETVR